MDMLVDDNYNENTRYAIQNPFALDLMVRLMMYLSKSDKEAFFVTLKTMVGKSTHNKSACCKINLIDTLLDLFPKFADTDLQRHAIELITQVGRHSMSVKELKRVFGLLKSNTEGARPAYVPDFLESLTKMSTSSGPRALLLFQR